MYRLKITQDDWDQLRSFVLSDLPNESGAFALVGCSKYGSGTDMLVRRVLTIPKQLFRVQREERLEISSRAINGIASLCEVNRLGVLVCHSHPTPSLYSTSDDYGERRLYDALKSSLPKYVPMVSLLISPGSVCGRVWVDANKTPLSLSEIIVVGHSYTRYNNNEKSPVFDEVLYDRQVRAFGADGQNKMSEAKVAIVGLGGTGSPTAEQLVRLGVKDIVLIDYDLFSKSNLTRMYGTYSDKMPLSWMKKRLFKPKYKVDIIAKHLMRINPDLRIKSIAGNIVYKNTVKHLLDRDVIFLCTDDHWGRSIVNEIAYQYLIPTINMGFSIRAENGIITAATGAIDVIRPGNACLWCSQFLNSARIAAESLLPEERKKRMGEGYVQDVDTPSPSVISLTTTISGLAVTQFLQLFTNFMGGKNSISRLRYDALTGLIYRCRTPIDQNCSCVSSKGFGDLKSLSAIGC